MSIRTGFEMMTQALMDIVGLGLLYCYSMKVCVMQYPKTILNVSTLLVLPFAINRCLCNH